MTEFLDLDALEAVARAATQERWYRVKSLPANHVVKAEVFPSEYVGESRPSLRVEVGGPNWTRDTDHIAAFDPPTAIGLIERVREAEAVIERVREALRDPYKRASLQNALNVLSKVDSALRGDQS